MEQHERIYTLRLTERQAKLLSYACDQYSRLICGQDGAYQELMEAAWEKRCKEAVGGNGMDENWDGGWYAMRHDAERYCNGIKKRFWGMARYAMFGVHYDDTADILFDIHQVIRHQLWLDMPDSEKSNMMVDASKAMQFGSEPLPEIESADATEEKLKATRIVDLPFSIRVLNCLKSADIETLYDLLRVSKISLLKIKNFGKNSLAEIDNYFKENGYQWGTEFLHYRPSNEDLRKSKYYLPKKEY